MSRIKELLRRIDARMTLWCAGGFYRWRWWMIVRNPMAYIILAAFFLFLHLASCSCRKEGSP